MINKIFNILVKMECKYVRQTTCMSFAFHPKTISLFSLVHSKNRLRIIQENLYTGLIMNDFPVPLREETMEVDNYTLCYNESLDLVIFTLSNHILIYSLLNKSLLVVLEATNKNSPLYISRTCTRGSNLYFSATEQKLIYGINLLESIKNASITTYLRYKISGTEAEIDDISVNNRILAVLCSDLVVRVWDLETMNQLKGVAIEKIGVPTCFCFSKNDAYLLIGTSDGHVQAYDGQSLGLRSVRIMSQKISNVRIQSMCWFHYAGESQSFRFLAFTVDGNVKLYSFWFEKKDDSVQGRCSQLSLLYINRHQINYNFMIQAHPFANFIFFSPGVLLYMVDSHPLIYYPVLPKPLALSFSQITPNVKKQIYYPRDIIFMKGLQILRLKDTIEQKLTLQDDLQYKELKILRVDMRPWSNLFSPQYTKLMVIYYLNSSIRVITMSRINLNEKCEQLGGYKQYNGSWVGFVGPREYYEPFIMIVQEDKQTITILSEQPSHPSDRAYSTPEEQKYFELGPGELYTKKTQIKIQKVYPTPFRNHYVVLYQSDNLLRFSNNISFDAELINYDVFTGISLRMDYTDIVLDVLWSYGGEMGAVLCLDKIVFINADLKIMRSVLIAGYVVQGIWVGFTLLITTKKDVQYVDILSKPQQAYCLQSLESKYLIMRVMADRIIGLEKSPSGEIVPKSRYFKLTEPIISGYLNYQKLAEIPIDEQKIKQIIEALVPYYIVTEEFIHLLNQRGLSSISKYFIQGNEKMYSKPLRAKTLNCRMQIERFVNEEVWIKNKRVLLDLYLAYEEAKDSNDPYEVEKGKIYAAKIKSIVGSIAFDSIKDLSTNESVKGVTINNNFGEQSLYQVYHDISKDQQSIKMEIYPFKAENCGEWLGNYGLYIESKPYYSEDATSLQLAQNNSHTNAAMMELTQNQGGDSQEDEEHPFKNLAIYLRCDDGKGECVEDLSDYGINGVIEDSDNWVSLEQEPMEVMDKWGKKCPPQFSLSTMTRINRKFNLRSANKLTFEIWIRPTSADFQVLRLGENIFLECKQLAIQAKICNSVVQFKMQINEKNQIKIGEWAHVAISINAKDSKVCLFLNSKLQGEAKQGIKLTRMISSVDIGDSQSGVDYTEIRIWTKCLEGEEIKENMRTPLELVAQKRKKLKMKLKEKKKKEEKGFGELNAFSLD